MGCKDIGIRKSEFVTYLRTGFLPGQFLLFVLYLPKIFSLPMWDILIMKKQSKALNTVVGVNINIMKMTFECNIDLY